MSEWAGEKKSTTSDGVHHNVSPHPPSGLSSECRAAAWGGMGCGNRGPSQSCGHFPLSTLLVVHMGYGHIFRMGDSEQVWVLHPSAALSMTRSVAKARQRSGGQPERTGSPNHASPRGGERQSLAGPRF